MNQSLLDEQILMYKIFLTVADLIHDLHAFLYKVITHYFQNMFEDSRESWIKHNTYFGYAVSMVSFTAILQMLLTELWKSIKNKYKKSSSLESGPRCKKWLLQEFGISHGYLWSFSLITCFIIILLGEDCEHFL